MQSTDCLIYQSLTFAQNVSRGCECANCKLSVCMCIQCIRDVYGSSHTGTILKKMYKCSTAIRCLTQFLLYQIEKVRLINCNRRATELFNLIWFCRHKYLQFSFGTVHTLHKMDSYFLSLVKCKETRIWNMKMKKKK